MAGDLTGNEYDDRIYREGGLPDDHRGLARLAAIEESFPYPTRPELSRAGKSTWRETVLPYWTMSMRHVHRFERETFSEHIDIGGEG